MILLDTGMLIAAVRKEDEKHQRAVELWAGFTDSGETLLFSEAVLAEFVTYMCRKHDAQTGFTQGRKLLETQGLELVQATAEEIKSALAMGSKYELDSYADALNAAVLQSKGIRKIASFDRGFDAIPGVNRIH